MGMSILSSACKYVGTVIEYMTDCFRLSTPPCKQHRSLGQLELLVCRTGDRHRQTLVASCDHLGKKAYTVMICS